MEMVITLLCEKGFHGRQAVKMDRGYIGLTQGGMVRAFTADGAPVFGTGYCIGEAEAPMEHGGTELAFVPCECPCHEGERARAKAIEERAEQIFGVKLRGSQ